MSNKIPTPAELFTSLAVEREALHDKVRTTLVKALEDNASELYKGGQVYVDRPAKYADVQQRIEEEFGANGWVVADGGMDKNDPLLKIHKK